MAVNTYHQIGTLKERVVGAPATTSS